MGALPHLLSALKSKEKKIIPFGRKGMRRKIVIRTDLCLTKTYYLYIYIFKNRVKLICAPDTNTITFSYGQTEMKPIFWQVEKI